LLGVSAAKPGDRILGLGSNGLHTNGYSLARKILAASGLKLADRLPGGTGETVEAALLASHRWYGPALTPLVEQGRARALAHVTGGGIAGNLVRVLPDGSQAIVDPSAWLRPPVFRWLMEVGKVPEDDARQVFNLGVGMIVVCAPEEAQGLVADLERAGERAWA